MTADKARAVIAGEERRIHFFAMDLPHSDACLVQAYPAETGEASATGTTSASRSSAECRVRSSTTTPSWRWRASSAMVRANVPRSSMNCSRTICSPIASGGRARAKYDGAEQEFLHNLINGCRVAVYSDGKTPPSLY
jgi:hypothetical protein